MASAFTLEMLAIDAYANSVREIGSLISELWHDSIMVQWTEDQLVDHWLDAWFVEPLEWDESRERSLDRDDAMRLTGRRVTYQQLPARRLFMPLKPKKSNPRALTFRPQAGWTQRGPDLGPIAAYDEPNSQVVFRALESDVQDVLGTALKLVNLINEDIEKVYGQMPAAILEMVRHQRTLLSTDDDALQRLANDLGVQIRFRTDAPRLVDVRERQEVRTIRAPSGSSGAIAEPQLSKKSIQRIVDLIDQSGKGIEAARREVVKLGEEGLRHMILSHLNAVFGGSDATGETFSKDGRPDLFIVREGRPVLIGECKIWHGSSEYSKTLVDQLGRYVPWRHAVAVLVTFASQRGFARVVEAAQEATRDSSTFTGMLDSRSESYFVSGHVHPDDPAKPLEVHHLLFNLYSAHADLG